MTARPIQPLTTGHQQECPFMAPSRAWLTYGEWLSPTDKRRYFGAIGGSSVGLVLLYVGKFLLDKNGRNTGSGVGWTLFLVGAIAAFLGIAVALRLIFRGQAAKRTAESGGPTDLSLDVIYDTSTWSVDVRAAVQDALTQRRVSVSWDSDELRLDRQFEALVDAIVAT
jgi:hypothetical protein